VNVRRALNLTIAACLLSGASAFCAEPIWSGDFETGDLSQWSPILDIQAGTTDRLVVVDEPVREGRHALKVTVKPGDLNNLGNRAEVVLTNPYFTQGQERWFHWYTLFPANFQTSPKWMLWTQWHSNGFGVPMGFNLHGETLSFRVMGHLYDQQGQWSAGTLWTAKIQPGKWNEYLFHVKFSDDSSVGFVELWVDGEQVIQKTHHQTLDTGDYVYLKQGLYRDKTIDWDATIYHDGFKVFGSDPRPFSTPTEPEPDVGTPVDPVDPSNPDAGVSNPEDPKLPQEPGDLGGSGCGKSGSAALLVPAPLVLGALRRSMRRRRKRS
jgi:hypothetical protein